jgi:spermidine synthase
MVVELAAVRVLAPWFGTSLVVWTNVIAVILLALALGYLVGGRLAVRGAPLAILGWTLLAAGLLVAWAAPFAAWIAERLLPDEIALHEAAGLVKWGSLAVAGLAFMPPAILLGTVSPLVVEALARARGLAPGSAGGAVLFVSTTGSLLGVFAASHVLLPGLGVQRTFLLSSGTLLLAGVLAHGLGRASARASALLVLVLAAAAARLSGPSPALRAGSVELARRESPYQMLRVVEERAAPTPLRLLQVNEGFDSFQSVWQPEPGLLPEGYYYNDFLLPFAWSEARDPWRVLVLGFGAGTVARVFAAEPERRVALVGIELDPVVVELGREFFELPPDSQRLRLHADMDARLALRVERGPFEQIVLDCYANQVEIPPHLCTLEFFREVRARLVDEGWLTANLGGFGFEDPVVSAVARTCARAFEGPVLLVRVPMSRNFVLLARRSGPLPFSRGALEPALHPTVLALAARRLPGFARRVDPDEDGPILSDDRSPMESLQRASLAEAAEARRKGSGS